MSEIFLTPVEALLYQEQLHVSLTVGSPLTTGAEIHPYYSTIYDVEDYHVEDGFPVADTALGIGIPVEAGVGAMSASETPGEIFDTPLGAVSRWLPVDGSFDDPAKWSAAQGTRRLPLYTDSTTPVLDTSFDYVRSGHPVGGSAMRLQGSDYFFTDSLAWGADTWAVLLVAVLRNPTNAFYGMLETFPQDSAADQNQPFVSLRYAADGTVMANSQGPRFTRNTSSQGPRTGQPLILAMHVDTASLLVTTVVVDKNKTADEYKLHGAHPQDARLYVGRSPVTATSAACMDILELDYFEDLSVADLQRAVTLLDSAYGVTT